MVADGCLARTRVQVPGLIETGKIIVPSGPTAAQAKRIFVYHLRHPCIANRLQVIENFWYSRRVELPDFDLILAGCPGRQRPVYGEVTIEAGGGRRFPPAQIARCRTATFELLWPAVIGQRTTVSPACSTI
jgi:hypothetical protein